ncbi:MAG: hypothetical protein JWR38_46 [Mucilaginibacter sp.]|nr:hypothetical protein [Mucilaginibacter sp.]
MLFEEFFKKKKIDLAALQAAEGALFSEFKTHYEQMGEKSFDHTKKYWFNKLRRQFPAAPEIKADKVIIENQLAEQTITESLIESGTPAPKLGFAPKFRAAGVAKPAEEKPAEPKAEETSAAAEPTAPKPAFKPRFNPGMVKPKPTESEVPPAEKPEIKEETPAAAEPTTPKPAFKPRFNPGMMKPKPTESETTPEVKEEAPVAAEPIAPKPAFKPRFNPGMVKSKPAESEVIPEEKPEVKEETPAPAEAPTPKLGFKPRFNTKNVPPKPTEE